MRANIFSMRANIFSSILAWTCLLRSCDWRRLSRWGSGDGVHSKYTCDSPYLALGQTKMNAESPTKNTSSFCQQQYHRHHHRMHQQRQQGKDEKKHGHRHDDRHDERPPPSPRTDIPPYPQFAFPFFAPPGPIDGWILSSPDRPLAMHRHVALSISSGYRKGRWLWWRRAQWTQCTQWTRTRWWIWWRRWRWTQQWTQWKQQSQ